MIKIDKIVAVWETLEPEATLTDLVDAISKKYHIANDAPLFYWVKKAMNENSDLFMRCPKVQPITLDNELSKIVTYDKFEIAYTKFLEQADRNAITQKSEGSKIPYGFAFEPKKNFICGGGFSQHFGQGAASKTPYISWHVVSIYYVVERRKIVLGIEESRYSHLKDMQPIKTEAIGKKDRYIAVFYECTKDAIDYETLYNKFISVSTQVMELGLK